MLGDTSIFQFLGLVYDGVKALLVFNGMTSEDLQGIHAFGFEHPHTNGSHLEGSFAAFSEAVHKVQTQTQFEFVDPPLLHQIVPEMLGEFKRGLILRRESQAFGVMRQSVHDVCDGKFARAANNTIVARGAHPHGCRGQRLLALIRPNHHKDFLRWVIPVRPEGTGAVRAGSICYLDEIVEARKDTTVVIHPLCDDRRVLPMGKLGESLQASPEFCMAISYNPGYQNALKDLKQSTRQRFVALEFNYPLAEVEQKIVAAETGIDGHNAQQLVKFAHMTRNLKGNGLDEGASTRLLVHAAKLIVSGIDPVTACSSSISQALTDAPEMLMAVNELSASVF